MSSCPVCQSPVSDDFGLLECGNCGAQLIVHMDGRVEHSQGDGLVAVESLEEDAQAPLAVAPVFAMPDPEVRSPAEAGLDEPLAQFEAESQPLFEFSQEESAAEGPASPEPIPVAVTQRTSASPDLSDIAEFGNSQASVGREGSLRYTIFIEGIDTSEVREHFREALTDRKLMWNVDEILRQIKSGEVTIANVSPAKAFVIIQRLRHLPLDIRWEQNAPFQA